jgi:hypothetical protein
MPQSEHGTHIETNAAQDERHKLKHGTGPGFRIRDKEAQRYESRQHRHSSSQWSSKRRKDGLRADLQNLEHDRKINHKKNDRRDR